MHFSQIHFSICCVILVTYLHIIPPEGDHTAMDIEKLTEQERYEMLVDIADQYYNQGKTQSEIAARYETNRFKIAKLLQDAKNEQIVEIKINHAEKVSKSLEKELCEAFSLERALVVNTQYAPYIDSLRQIGEVGAGYLHSLLTPGSALGITWGKTIYSVISQLPGANHTPVSAVQLTGCLSLSNPAVNSRELTHTVASAYYGSCYHLDLPLYVTDPEILGPLLREPLILNTLDRTREMTAVITGIGGRSSLPLTNPLFQPYLTERDLAQEEHCIGSIYGYVIDRQGEVADLDLNRRVVATPLSRILSTPHRIAVVSGRHKVLMVSKVLQSGLVNELILDTDTALHLLELKNKYN